MSATRLATAISNRFRDAAAITSFKRKEWFMDPRTEYTWRDHLLRTFSRRLRHVTPSVSPQVIDEATRFVGLLEQFSPDDTPAYFSARSDFAVYDGWAINYEIAYCIPRDVVS